MRNKRTAIRYLSLIAAEAVLVKAALARLTPLLLRSRGTTTVTTSATWLHLLRLHLLRLHLLRLHLLVVHARTSKAGLLLGKGLSARAGSCPRIRLCFSVL